ncbi:MAG: YceI family protein [Gammaproteobacteria bacterium]
MNTSRLFRVGAFAIMLLAGTVAVAEDELCEPFQNGVVDEALVKDMLTAARNGNLYRIRPKSSKVGFCIDSQFNEIKGDFRDFQGGLAIGADEEINGQTMVVVRTASLDTGGSLLEALLKGKRFFDVKQYPEILFISNGFEWTGEHTAVLTGDLTLHGVTRPVVFDVELTNITEDLAGKSNMILFKATTSIRRSEFGMDTLSTVASDTVKICMSVEALKHKT